MERAHITGYDGSAFSGDGKFFFQWGGLNDRAEIFEAPNPKPRAFKPTPDDCSIHSAAFSNEGDNLLLGCSNGGLRLYRLSSGALIRSFAGMIVGQDTWSRTKMAARRIAQTAAVWRR